MKHELIQIMNENGERVQAQAPMIISASRATDIPAFYTNWFFNRLKKGYVAWLNPFNGKISYVSFWNVRFIVFWSKNPEPLIPYIQLLKDRGIGCYVQYTLNDYESEKLEPNVPNLQQRIETFKRLVDVLGMGSVIWRFDPLILTETIGVDELLMKVSGIGDALKGYTEKLIFSYADIINYKKVIRNLEVEHVKYQDWDETLMINFAEKLNEINVEKWCYQLATCSEMVDLEHYGIEHNKCIDAELISKLSPKDDILQQHLKAIRRDKGQRKLCGCILSKDIGQYNTCPHLCKYCYANNSANIVMNNYKKHKSKPFSETII